jgi:hypothetical protein
MLAEVRERKRRCIVNENHDEILRVVPSMINSAAHKHTLFIGAVFVPFSFQAHVRFALGRELLGNQKAVLRAHIAVCQVATFVDFDVRVVLMPYVVERGLCANVAMLVNELRINVLPVHRRRQNPPVLFHVLAISVAKIFQPRPHDHFSVRWALGSIAVLRDMQFFVKESDGTT